MIGSWQILKSMDWYTNDTVKACQMAKILETQIAVLTDSEISPLSAPPQNTLRISVTDDFFFSSMIAGLLYIEALLSSTVEALGEKAVEKIKQNEFSMSKLNVEQE